MEYLEYFQLTSEPFSNAPLSRFYFASRQHTEALNRLMYAASSMKGLAILIGDIGHGKTTLARRMLDALPESEYEAAMLVIVHAGITPNWLLKRIASQLGVSEPADDKLTILSQLYQRLLQIYQAGKRAVVIIDEAQMLASRELMEEFRGLLNLEVPDRKLITFVFFGLPEIVRNLQLDPPLAQRIALRYQLKPLTAEDTAAYIDHRLRIAGAKRQFFPAPVVEEIHRVTGGVPRLINTVCDNVLLEMFFAKQRVADLELVQQVASNFGLPQEPGGPSIMPPPMPIEEELALEGAPGHDAIVAVPRHPEEPVSPPAGADDDVPSAVTVGEAADIAARVADEATPVPPEVDDEEQPSPELFAARVAETFEPPPGPPPAPPQAPPSIASMPADIADPLAFLHEPIAPEPDAHEFVTPELAAHESAASELAAHESVAPELATPDSAAYASAAPDSAPYASPAPEPAVEPPPYDGMLMLLDKSPELAPVPAYGLPEGAIEQPPPPPPYTNGEDETQVLTSELANLDIEVVDDGQTLDFAHPSGGESDHELEAMTPAAEPLTQQSEGYGNASSYAPESADGALESRPTGVPLGRITPVSRPVPGPITEMPYRSSLSPAALAGSPSASLLSDADALLTAPPPTPPASDVSIAKTPYKTTTGKTIDLSEIDDLLNDLKNLTKK